MVLTKFKSETHLKVEHLSFTAPKGNVRQITIIVIY